MSSTAIAALPEHGDAQQWTPQEAALMEAVGLVQRKGQQLVIAPRAVAESFLAHCRRSGLDPVARQIYCIERAGKWQTQVSIDGARLVAERSRQYRGQTPVQWTADGVTWVDVWLADTNPAAARVGVRREGFDEPLYAVATWKEYAIPNGNMWKKMPALMLGKVAEMLALRKAFPQDLSGLYSAEEMDQASQGASSRQRPAQAAVEAVVEPVGPSKEELEAYLLEVAGAADMQVLRGLHRAASERGWLALVTDAAGTTVEHLLWERKRALENPEPVEAEEPADLVEQADAATGEVQS